jgi:hypothetical protein
MVDRIGTLAFLARILFLAGLVALGVVLQKAHRSPDSSVVLHDATKTLLVSAHAVLDVYKMFVDAMFESAKSFLRDLEDYYDRVYTESRCDNLDYDIQPEIEETQKQQDFISNLRKAFLSNKRKKSAS